MIPENTKRTTTSVFRQRGYSCPRCKTRTMVFGNDPAPVRCEACQKDTELKLEWDHLVDQTVKVTDFPSDGK